MTPRHGQEVQAACLVSGNAGRPMFHPGRECDFGLSTIEQYRAGRNPIATVNDRAMGAPLLITQPRNAAWTAFIADSPLARSTITEILISLVEIISMLMPCCASVSNILAATPV